MDDWYTVKFTDIKDKGIGGLLMSKYNASLAKALPKVYPEHQWKPWKFERVAHGFWDVDDNAKQFLTELGSNLGFKSLDDYYTLSWKHFFHLGAGKLLQKSGGLMPLLTKHFPEHKWKEENRATFPSKTQLMLRNMLKSIFPTCTVILDHKRSDMRRARSLRRMELDIYVKEHKLAFEYQGEQHYNMHYLYGSPTDQQQRDQEKREACIKAGITLIEIPFWWDQKQASLIATLHAKRPDLVPNKGNGQPIAEDMPKKFSQPALAERIILERPDKWASQYTSNIT